MEFIVKNEYNNGDQDIMEIYHPTNKIKEIWLNAYTELNEETGEEEIKTDTLVMLWNATENEPLVIAKSRKDDYSVSDELLEVENAASEIE